MPVSSNVDDSGEAKAAEQAAEPVEQDAASDTSSEPSGEPPADAQDDDDAGAAEPEPRDERAAQDGDEGQPSDASDAEGQPSDASDAEGQPSDASDAEGQPSDASDAEDSADGDDEPAAEDAPQDEAPDDEPQDEPPADEPQDDASEAAAKPEPKGKRDDGEDKPFEEDGRADQALDFVVDVLTKMGMDCTVDLMENDPGDPPSDIRIEISGRDAGKLIGKKGQTLAALQFLTNRVVNRPSRPRRHILIDADGYRARREQALSSMARRLGKEAVAEGKIITFEPMSAQDRRVVHLALAKFAGVVTKSEGKGATRRVQIIPVRE